MQRIRCRLLWRTLILGHGDNPLDRSISPARAALAAMRDGRGERPIWSVGRESNPCSLCSA